MEGNVCPARLRIVDVVSAGTTRLLIEGDPHEFEDEVYQLEDYGIPGLMLLVNVCKHCGVLYKIRKKE